MNNKWHVLFIVDEIKCTHSNILSIEQLFSLYTYNSCSLVGKFPYGTRLFFGENAFTVLIGINRGEISILSMIKLYNSVNLSFTTHTANVSCGFFEHRNLGGLISKLALLNTPKTSPKLRLCV